LHYELQAVRILGRDLSLEFFGPQLKLAANHAVPLFFFELDVVVQWSIFLYLLVAGCCLQMGVLGLRENEALGDLQIGSAVMLCRDMGLKHTEVRRSLNQAMGNGKLDL